MWGARREPTAACSASGVVCVRVPLGAMPASRRCQQVGTLRCQLLEAALGWQPTAPSPGCSPPAMDTTWCARPPGACARTYAASSVAPSGLPWSASGTCRRPSAASGRPPSSACTLAWLAGERAGATTVAPACRKARATPEPTMPACSGSTGCELVASGGGGVSAVASSPAVLAPASTDAPPTSPARCCIKGSAHRWPPSRRRSGLPAAAPSRSLRRSLAVNERLLWSVCKQGRMKVGCEPNCRWLARRHVGGAAHGMMA